MLDLKIEMEKKLLENFHPNFLSVENESFRHSVPKGSQTHFRIEIVSDVFLGLNLLKRHRLVQECLKNELNLAKACSLHLHTPEEWQERKEQKMPSPTCRGG